MADSRGWTCLITNNAYLPGLLVLNHSLQRVQSRYRLTALFTDALSPEAQAALDLRGIPKRKIDHLLPKTHKDYSNDPRFYDCWSKLASFNLLDFERVVQLDADMLVMRNMDELMDLPLDAAATGGKGHRVFAASHACVCNPLKKAHYPKDWVPENCAFTSQHSDPDSAQTEGAAVSLSLSMPNGGLLVLNPSAGAFEAILEALEDERTSTYEFADQSLLGDVFHERWVTLPYIYNALKTLRLANVHGPIWRDAEVKNVHYILSPKPWDLPREQIDEELMLKWWDVNDERRAAEKARGIDDGF